MKWHVFALACSLVMLPGMVSAQRIIAPEIGKIALVEDSSPSVWGMSGMEMIYVRKGANGQTPVTRTLAWDARTVEILSHTQSPPLRASDVRAVSINGRDFVVVRRYLLLEVTSEDARAEQLSKPALARKWANSVRRVLPQVAPMPNRFGV